MKQRDGQIIMRYQLYQLHTTFIMGFKRFLFPPQFLFRGLLQRKFIDLNYITALASAKVTIPSPRPHLPESSNKFLAKKRHFSRPVASPFSCVCPLFNFLSYPGVEGISKEGASLGGGIFQCYHCRVLPRP